ncbi:conserved hypothetical protein [Vibrio jasicida]|uniref:hypothetical protein n=1 Tax=Vibrio jasicida TaxID=766224 RepID=UPI002895714F|nr:conserved hypothetical protein [Vibrio jasicida]
MAGSILPLIHIYSYPEVAMLLKLMLFLLLILLITSVYASPTTPKTIEDLDDPTALSSFIGLRTGTNGYGAIGQIGFNSPDSVLGHNSFLQFKDDFETVHLRHFSIYKPSGSGLFLDAQRNNTGSIVVNRASLGAIQIIPVLENLRVNPAFLYGETWTENEAAKNSVFPNTSILTLYTFIRWQVTSDWFVNLVPQYTYSIKGRKIRLFELVTQVGHNITKDSSVAMNTDEDDNFWLTLKHAF